MNALKPIPFAISSAKGYSHKNNSSDLINMFVHIEQAGSKSNHILMNTEGSELITTVTDEIYGMYEFKGVVYVVTAREFLEFNDKTQQFTRKGSVTFGNKVSFADNGIDIVMVGGYGYSYTPSTDTFKHLNTEDGWYHSHTVAYMDGYFIFNRNDSGQFFISKLYSTELNPIDWATAESAPDDTVAVVVSNRQLWLLGERSSEVWYDSGDQDFPFTRINGAVTDIGITNHDTVANIRNSIFFVGNDFRVYMTHGYTPTVVSTAAIDKALSESDLLTLTAFSFMSNGHWFYSLSIDDNLTYVYDMETQQWHRRMSCEVEKWEISGAMNRHNSNNVVGYAENNFYSLSLNHLTEHGSNIRREAVTLPFNDTVNRFTLAEVQLDAEVALEANAEVILQSSKDGGRTWSNNHYANMGDTGEHTHRVRWLRLGQYRDCILKIVITEPISIRILGLHARIG